MRFDLINALAAVRSRLTQQNVSLLERGSLRQGWKSERLSFCCLLLLKRMMCPERRFNFVNQPAIQAERYCECHRL